MDALQTQGELFDAEVPPPHKPAKRLERSGSFTNNMKLPVHRWFRYSAGFSAEWAEDVIRQREARLVFDPFVGSGTTLLAAQCAGIPSVGTEHHSFVYRVAEAKLHWTENESELARAASKLVRQAQSRVAARPRSDSDLLNRCYTTDALCKLEALKLAYRDSKLPAGLKSLLWLALTSILRECSGVGTAQWQYVLPNKSKARVEEPFAAFMAKIECFCADMATMKASSGQTSSKVHYGDARQIDAGLGLNGRVDLIVTSPPYPNNYDYADATRIEMTFWEEIAGWSDLQTAVRHRLVRSCSQHSAAEKLLLPDLLADPAISPIRGELRNVCDALAEARMSKGGKKTYHTMVAAYFADLARVWQSLRPLCADGAEVIFVIGDSAPYGVYVPVDKWLGELAAAAGFKNIEFDKLRDRNMKWKNRKHRVPLKEGILTVRA